MRVTIKDIAEITGYSVSTVSKVLNNKAKSIPQSTRDIIFSTAESHSYRPNQLAIGLIKKTTKTIGLIISDIRNPFFSTLTKGVEDECRKNNWNMFLCNTNDDHQTEMEYISALADKGVDGILYNMAVNTDSAKAEESCKLMRHLSIPFVMSDRYYQNCNCPSVVVAHDIGGFLATEHLISLGHRRIACVTGPDFLLDSWQRLEGYKAALKKYNIPYDQSLIVQGSYTLESGLHAMDYLLNKDFTGVFAFNDLTAIGVFNRAQELGLNIPKDFSLVSYDDTMLAGILSVPLTCVRQPIYQIGKQAAKLLLELTANTLAASNNKIILKPDLVVRRSTYKLS